KPGSLGDLARDLPDAARRPSERRQAACRRPARPRRRAPPRRPAPHPVRYEDLMTDPNAPESKSAEVAAAFDEFNRDLEAFKETNDTRLADIETRLSADVVTEDKLARIETTV